MGMLATMINALALQNALESTGIYSRLMSAIPMTQFAEPFIRRKAIRHLEKNKSGYLRLRNLGIHFSQRILLPRSAHYVEIDADAVFKGTRVDGIYDSDPEKNTDAKHIPSISYMEVLASRSAHYGLNRHHALPGE